MKATIGAVCALALLTLVAACSSVQVVSDYDPDADFSQYRTFAFISDNPMIIAQAADPVNPLTEGRFMDAIAEGLAASGLTQVDNREQADLAVSFTLGSRNELRVDSYPMPYRTGLDRWTWGRSYYTDVTVREYTKGQFALDLFDVKQRAPVWHGKASKTITSADRSAPVETINEIVGEVLAAYPPR